MNNETFDAKRFPVSRIGNIINPKLIILLENSNSDPKHMKSNPEYTIWRDNKFEPLDKSLDKHITLDIFIDYDKWWYNLWTYCKDTYENLEINDILALEYYPYFTENDDDKQRSIYRKKNNGWDAYAIKTQKTNIKLLESAIKLEIPIFIYYKSGWLSLKNENGISIFNPKINKYINFDDYDKKSDANTQNYRGSKKAKLISFLSKPEIINRIEILKKTNNYHL